LAFLARNVGPFSMSDAAPGYSELPALLFEVVALNEAHRHGALRERKLWSSAVVEQAIHFLLRLPTTSEFERRVYAEPDMDLESAWSGAVGSLWPDNVARRPEEMSWRYLETALTRLDALGKNAAKCVKDHLSTVCWVQPTRGSTGFVRSVMS
jgi:hypothetical protein